MRWLAALVLCVFAATSQAGAQEVSRPSVLIVDSDRLYTETLYGLQIEADLLALQAEFQAENDAIADTLRREELDLTARRPDMSPEAFRAEAEAFDQKVQEVRRARDAKNGELLAARADARARFEERVQGIVAGIMLERGAAVVLEQRNVVLSVRSANITDDVIVRVDAQLGTGRQ